MRIWELFPVGQALMKARSRSTALCRLESSVEAHRLRRRSGLVSCPTDWRGALTDSAGLKSSTPPVTRASSSPSNTTTACWGAGSDAKPFSRTTVGFTSIQLVTSSLPKGAQHCRASIRQKPRPGPIRRAQRNEDSTDRRDGRRQGAVDPHLWGSLDPDGAPPFCGPGREFTFHDGVLLRGSGSARPPTSSAGNSAAPISRLATGLVSNM
jgi:hypothetical protein